MREIPLTKGKIALVDDADYEWLNGWKWLAVKRRRYWYAGRKLTIAPNKQRLIKMHQVIMRPPTGLVVDHINHNGLDNRRMNLRICTSTENVRNAQKRRGFSRSQYKGVTQHTGRSKWIAQIVVGGIHRHLGSFDSEWAAARAYDAAAREACGEFACLNGV